MKQLGVLDAAFINLEHPNTPQQIGGLGIYDPSTAPGGFVRFKQVIESFERRLNKFPMFRSRLVMTPGDLDKPYWVADANFDVEFHIRHIALPQPGDWRQLCILVSRIHARPLDMARPLWEAYIIEGLDNIEGVPPGGFAIYTKMHHSLVDGAGGASFMSAIHDLEPDPAVVEEAAEPILVDAKPSKLQLLSNAAINNVKNTAGLAKGSVGLIRDLGKLALDIQRDKVPAPSIQAPKTRFNQPVGPYRVFDAAEFDFSDIKFIKDIAGAKVNDVVLTIVGEAMRRYLESKGEAPEDGSLAANVPINLRTRRGETGDNNQVGAVFMNMCTDVNRLLERVQAVHEASREALEFGEQSPLADALKLAGVLAPVLTKPLVRTYINRQMGQLMPASVSTVVSNVAGPPFPLYSAGAEMVRYYGMGLLTPSIGLFHLCFTASGVMTLSFLADRDAMPDPAFYRECLTSAFDDLLAEAKVAQTKMERQAGKQAGTTATTKKPAAKKAAAKKAAAKKAAAKKKAVSKKKAVAKKAVAKTASAEKASEPKPTAEAKPESLATQSTQAVDGAVEQAASDSSTAANGAASESPVMTQGSLIN